MNSVQNMAVQYQKPGPYEGFLQGLNNKNKRIEDIWKDNFKSSVQNLSQKASTMTWTNQNNNNNNNININNLEDDGEERNNVTIKHEEDKQDVELNNVLNNNVNENIEETAVNQSNQEKEEEPSHHARRPMNAFLIFCKKHRPIVRKKYPSLENRGVTRILGEWWALLDSTDKEAYTNLAKEYKDAFFTANPNFKWYKLPAPPLRPQAPIQRPVIQLKDPTTFSSTLPETIREAQFTPGKLADESQLGLLSSLLNPQVPPSQSNKQQQQSHQQEFNNSTTQQIKREEKFIIKEEQNNNLNNNNIEMKMEGKDYLETDKPLKKRKFDDVLLNGEGDLMVEDDDEYLLDKMKFKKETRTSGRSCKGKRYAEFMRNGKLLKNKRDKREDYLNLLSADESERDFTALSETVPLESTIKRLVERTKMTEGLGGDKQPSFSLTPAASVNNTTAEVKEETSTTLTSSALPSSTPCFNLELRIDELPSLSYETYLQRKRESKKRKTHKKTTHKARPEVAQHEDKITGSKKRKNKQNITHLQSGTLPEVRNLSVEPQKVNQELNQISNGFSMTSSDLSGLATLAEIAANTQKIDEC